MGCLYQIQSPSGKSYIGITEQDVERRWQHHQSHTACRALANAIAKYGADNFTVRVLVTADWSYLVDLEKKAIEAFNTKVPNGYNLTNGGDGTQGYQHTPDAIRKIRKHAKERRLSTTHKSRISDSLRGRKRPDHAQKLKGRKRPDHSRFMRELWAKRKQGE